MVHPFDELFEKSEESEGEVENSDRSDFSDFSDFLKFGQSVVTKCLNYGIIIHNYRLLDFYGISSIKRWRIEIVIKSLKMTIST